MKKLASVFFATLGLLILSSTAAKAEYKFNFVMHSDTNNAFWAAVHKGFKDACAQIDADCQMLTLSGDGDQQEQLQNFESSIAQGVDGIVTTITNPTIFDAAVDEALAAGIPVITANTDDPEGAAGSNRLAYVGQDLEAAGYELASNLSKMFPDGDVHVLIGVADMNQSWAYTRGNGIARFMEDYKAANPDRKVTYEKIESGLDLSTVGNRVAAYVQANPNTTAYLDVGSWEAGAAAAVRNLGYKPGEILLAGFDLVDVVFEEMDKGYVQLTVDQQPYYQGYMSVHQLYLMNKYGLRYSMQFMLGLPGETKQLAWDSLDMARRITGPRGVHGINIFKPFPGLEINNVGLELGQYQASDVMAPGSVAPQTWRKESFKTPDEKSEVSLPADEAYMASRQVMHKTGKNAENVHNSGYNYGKNVFGSKSMVYYDNYRRDKLGLYILKLSRYSHLLIRFPGIKKIVEKIIEEFPDNPFNRIVWKITESLLNIRIHANVPFSFFVKYFLFHRNKQIR